MYRINKEVVSFYKRIIMDNFETFEDAEKYLVNELNCNKISMYDGKYVYYENGIADEYGQVPRYTIEKR